MFLKTVSCCVLLLTPALNPGAQQQQAQQQPRTAPAPAPVDFQISGTLVDWNTGQPIPRARVAIAPVTQRDNFTTILTGPDGRFLFTGLAAGKYTLTAQARGYLLQSFNQHDQLSSSIVAGPELDSSNLLFRLAAEGAISGVVTDEAGEPVRDAQVGLYFTGFSGGAGATRPRGSTLTDDQGAYHFGHLAAGRYLVGVIARPWYAQNNIQQVFRGTSGSDGTPWELTIGNEDSRQLDVAYPVTFSGGVTDPGAATPIVLGRGDKVTADFSLQPVPTLHIRMHRDNPDPGRLYLEILEMRALDGPANGMTLQIHGFPQGEDEVFALAPGHYTVRRYTANANSPGELSREIDITGSGELDKNQGNVYVPVSAKMQFEPGASSGQAYLQLLNKKSGQVFSESIGDKNEVALRQGVPPGSYEVSLTNSPSLYVKRLSASGASVTGRTIEIRPGNAVKLAITAAPGRGTIIGTALREGKRCAGAMIVLAPADPAHNSVLFRRDQSDTDGTFTLANVVPGAYTVLAIENGWELEWTKPEVLKSYMSQGTALEVQVNGKYEVKLAVQ